MIFRKEHSAHKDVCTQLMDIGLFPSAPLFPTLAVDPEVSHPSKTTSRFVFHEL